MKPDDVQYLQHQFEDLLSYDSDDIFEKIEPLTYRTPEGNSCQHIAAQRGDDRAIQILIDAGLDVNLKGDMGETPLHCAYLCGQMNVARLLVEAGADPNAKDEFGRLPADAASSR